jgi:hypothetical protein
MDGFLGNQGTLSSRQLPLGSSGDHPRRINNNNTTARENVDILDHPTMTITINRSRSSHLRSNQNIISHGRGRRSTRHHISLNIIITGLDILQEENLVKPFQLFLLMPLILMVTTQCQVVTLSGVALKSHSRKGNTVLRVSELINIDLDPDLITVTLRNIVRADFRIAPHQADIITTKRDANLGLGILTRKLIQITMANQKRRITILLLKINRDPKMSSFELTKLEFPKTFF